LDIGARKDASGRIKLLLVLSILAACLLHTTKQNANTDKFRNPFFAFKVKANQVYSYQNFRWLATVYSTVDYIVAHTQEDEKILALPFDPLYYFLTERDSSTRQLIFFEHKNITEAQEQNIIEGLKKQNVNYIILSSRSIDPVPGMGVFGKTYCSTLNDYIVKNYEVVAQFGDWKNLAGWAWNHGTKINIEALNNI